MPKWFINSKTNKLLITIQFAFPHGIDFITLLAALRQSRTREASNALSRDNEYVAVSSLNVSLSLADCKSYRAVID